MAVLSFELSTVGPFDFIISASELTPTTSSSATREAYLIALKWPQWHKSKQPSTKTLPRGIGFISSMVEGSRPTRSINLKMELAKVFSFSFKSKSIFERAACNSAFLSLAYKQYVRCCEVFTSIILVT